MAWKVLPPSRNSRKPCRSLSSPPPGRPAGTGPTCSASRVPYGQNQNRNRQQAQYVRNLQRQRAVQQQQVRRYLENLHHQQYNMQRAYQAAMRRQWQIRQQQANYIRQRLAAAYRAPQHHSHTVYHHTVRRR